MKDKNEIKLPDINYALMAQLSYLKWNDLKKEKSVKDMLLNSSCIEIT